MDLSTAVAIIGVLVSICAIGVTVALFVITGLKTEIANLYRIKSAISAELSAHKVEAAREFVTYPRLTTLLEQHNKSLTASISRIEDDLKVLPQLRDLITTLAARMNVPVGKASGLEAIRG